MGLGRLWLNGASKHLKFDIKKDLARTHVSYYNDDAKRTKDMYRQRIQKA